MNLPKSPQKAPYQVTLEANKTYWWCACGLSDQQPFCSGAHKGTDMTPVKVILEETKTVFLCGCKHTQNKPYCDGTHRTLKEE